MSEDNKIVDGAKDVVEGVADVTKETVGAVGDVGGRLARVVLGVEQTRDVCVAALLRRDPQVRAARVRHHLEGLRRLAHLDLDVVLRVLEVLHDHWRGRCRELPRWLG